MNIKYLSCGIVITIFSVSAFAQKSAVTTAKTGYEEYAAIKTASPQLAQPKIKAAKEAIDKAVVHEKTMADPVAWTVRALIYADLASSDNSGAAASLKSEAISALTKAKELDKEGKNKDDIAKAANLLYVSQFNIGKQYLDKEDYKNAYSEFNKGLEFAPGDTLLNFAAGIAAMNGKDYPNAIARFNELLPTKYSGLEGVYSNLSVLYSTVKDTANAIRIAAEGATKFPNNKDLPVREIELSLMSGHEKEVISKISAQAQKDPSNKQLFYYLGIAYNEIKDFAKAEESYKKALALDPNFIEANINLSGVIMNSGIDIYNKANKIPTNKVAEYNAAKKKALAEFDKALPYLQKAVELNPKSEMALKNLRRYYEINNNAAKISEIDAKIKGLKN